MTQTQTKDIYRNASEGVCGVVVIDNNEPKGIAVQPGHTIPLSEEERIATANAPRLPEDNPFTNGTLVLDTPAEEIKNRRPIDSPHAEPEVAPEKKSEPESEDREPTQEPTPEEQKAKAEAARQAEAKAQAEMPGKPVDETGAPKQPQGLPHQGRRAPQEEVATPDAPVKAGAKE